MFRDKMIFLCVISAILIPLIFLTNELILIGLFILLFISNQVIILVLFYRAEKTRFDAWYAFWIAILSLVFMLVFILLGKTIPAEFFGLILFLLYFVGIVVFLFKKEFNRVYQKKEKKSKEKDKAPKDEDYESFREKDELNELVEFFEPESSQEVEIVDMGQPKIEKIVMEEVEPEKPDLEIKSTEEKIAEQLEEIWKQDFDIPKSMVFESKDEPIEPREEPQITETEEVSESQAEPEIRELKEAPKVDFEKVKKDLERIDDGVKTISDKIKLISEKAILEGAEKKIKQEQKKKKTKAKKSEMKVFASKIGTKYHYDKNCLGMKRVSKKNFTTYDNSAEARKKKLTQCDLCK